MNPIWVNVPPSPISPGILQLIEKPTIWFNLLTKLTGFYMYPKKTEIPKFTRNIVSEWVKLREKKGRVAVLMLCK